MNDNLPERPTNEFLKEMGIKIPDVEPLVTDANASLDTTRAADIEIFNMHLRILYAMWAEVRTFSQAMTMIDKSMALIEKRRHILGHPYGAPTNSTPKIATFEPLP